MKIGVVGFSGIMLSACLITADIQITNTSKDSINYDLQNIVTILPEKWRESDREEVIHALDFLNDLGLEPRKVFGLYGKVSPRRGNTF